MKEWLLKIFVMVYWCVVFISSFKFFFLFFSFIFMWFVQCKNSQVWLEMTKHLTVPNFSIGSSIVVNAIVVVQLIQMEVFFHHFFFCCLSPKWSWNIDDWFYIFIRSIITSNSKTCIDLSGDYRDRYYCFIFVPYGVYYLSSHVTCVLLLNE